MICFLGGGRLDKVPVEVHMENKTSKNYQENLKKEGGRRELALPDIL